MDEKRNVVKKFLMFVLVVGFVMNFSGGVIAVIF